MPVPHPAGDAPPQRYRILTEQTHSVMFEGATSFQLNIGPHACKAFFRPMHTDAETQRTLGGMLVHLEFECEEPDLLRAASLGLRLTEDLFAGLAVVTGIPFGQISLVQLTDVTLPAVTGFVVPITPKHLHWDEPVSSLQVGQVRKLLAHWDGLPKGGRIRRAAALYRRALLEKDDDLSAFQYSYMGLEALEPPLAGQLGLKAGVEESKGKCEKCGAEFVRRKTVLNGVRAYIRGASHAGDAHPEREKEWKAINALRQDQFHSLKDSGDLFAAAHATVPATAHFLHDAICCLSHAHELESPKFRMARGARTIFFIGEAEPGIDDALEECRPIVEIKDITWVPHAEHGYVPSVNLVKNRSGVDIGGDFHWLTGPLQLLAESDLRRAHFETGDDTSPEPIALP